VSDNLIAGIIGGAVTLIVAIIGYLAKLRSDRIIEREKHNYQLEIALRNLEAEYDKSLQKSRIDTYSELWTILWVWNKTFFYAFDLNTGEEIDKFNKSLLDWYYDKGGMILSERSNTAFLEATAKLKGIAFLYSSDKAHTFKDNLAEWKSISNLLDKIRIEMIKDIGTRKSIVFPQPINPQINDKQKAD
jgi:hypothetical protein